MMESKFSNAHYLFSDIPDAARDFIKLPEERYCDKSQQRSQHIMAYDKVQTFYNWK